MKKAEKIFQDTYTECRMHVRAWGLEYNPNGEAVGFSGLITQEPICTRTINAVQKCLDSQLKELDLYDKYNINGEEGKARRSFYRQALEMVQSTINNSRKDLKKFNEWLKSEI